MTTAENGFEDDSWVLAGVQAWYDEVKDFNRSHVEPFVYVLHSTYDTIQFRATSFIKWGIQSHYFLGSQICVLYKAIYGLKVF